MNTIAGLQIKDVTKRKLSIFEGLQFDFTVKGLPFMLMVGGKESLFPMNVIHKFPVDRVCPLCNRYVLTYPNGQQPCSFLIARKNELMDICLLQS